MLESFDYAKLNPEAKRYLGDVRRRAGRGAPGVFFAVSDNRPIWAFFAGIAVLPLCLWIGYTSSKAPWATAMLQTAGVLLGGWLVWFAVRRWTASIDGSAGYFTYFDPAHAFVGEGETLAAIAYQEYGDSGLWRQIAEHNPIPDPRRLKAGQPLIIKPLISDQ